jgi:hypothetical protein
MLTFLERRREANFSKFHEKKRMTFPFKATDTTNYFQKLKDAFQIPSCFQCWKLVSLDSTDDPE